MARGLLISFFLGLASSAMATQATFFVSPSGSDSNPGTEALPFLTLDHARIAVRTLAPSMTDDIIVYLRGGLHTLSATVNFDQNDSGTNGFGVVYKAYPGERPIISGGRLITGWAPVGGGIYKAAAGTTRFRQLYVNDRRAIRARTPNQGDYYRLKWWTADGSSQVIVNAGEVANWQNLNDVEIVIQQLWTQSNLRIASLSIVGAYGFVVPMNPERTRVYASAFPPRWSNEAYHFENAYEFLDASGEWYLNTVTNEVFYKPYPGEDLAASSVIAPSLDALIRMKGTLAAPVNHIRFEGLTFAHSNWLTPSSIGFLGSQAIATCCGNIPGGVELESADDISFTRDVIEHMGGSGIVLSSAAHNNSLIGNVVKDISGSGIVVDSMLIGIPADSRSTCKNNLIQNNSVSGIGQDYYGSIGIFAGYTDSSAIEHNEVSDTPYTGISVGWGWTPYNTVLKNNLIRYNHIHDVMKLLSDGGGIYTLSKQSGTTIAGNYIHDLMYSPWLVAQKNAGIYLDNGSNFMTVQDNVISNSPITVYSQTLAPVAGPNNTLSNNDGASPTTIADAGLEPAYRDITTTPVQTSSGATTVGGASLALIFPFPELPAVNAVIPTGAFPAGTALSLSAGMGLSLGSIRSNEAGITPFGSSVGFDLSAGGLQPSIPVRMTLAYNTTMIPAGQDERRLRLMRYDPAAGQWTLVESQVDTSAHTLTALTSHLSIFAPFFVTPGADLTAVQIFPQPWEIGDASSVYWAPSLTLSKLPADARVRLLTLSGESIWEGTATAGGVLTWDGKTRFGKEAASGTYYAVIESNGRKSIKRVVVVR